jgi:hypothetical protein
MTHLNGNIVLQFLAWTSAEVFEMSDIENVQFFTPIKNGDYIHVIQGFEAVQGSRHVRAARPNN